MLFYPFPLPAAALPNFVYSDVLLPPTCATGNLGLIICFYFVFTASLRLLFSIPGTLPLVVMLGTCVTNIT